MFCRAVHYDRIVVKQIEEQEATRNGIFIPDSAKEKPQQGEVVRGRCRLCVRGPLSWDYSIAASTCFSGNGGKGGGGVGHGVGDDELPPCRRLPQE